MAYYNICPNCNAHLDPGEKCNCKEPDRKRTEYFANHLKTSSVTGQIEFKWDAEGMGTCKGQIK